MSSVRNCVSLSNARFFGATLITGAILFGAACHSGVETPVSPSIEGISVPTASSTALAGGPLEFTMVEMGGSGYSGTCTVGTGGAGFRLKAVGQGMPNTTVRFILRETTTSERVTDFAEVDQRGGFRTSQDRVTFPPFLSGATVECLLMARADATVLAQGQPFQIP